MTDTTIDTTEYDLAPLEFADEIETDTAQVLANVGKLVQDIIWQRKKPRMSIPADYCDDDLVIGGAINQAEKDLKEAARLIRTLTAENERLKPFGVGISETAAVDAFAEQESEIAALTTKLTDAEAMLAVKPSAMEYADQTLRITELEAGRFIKTVDEKVVLQIGDYEVVMLPGDTILNSNWIRSTPPGPEDE